MYTFHDAYYLDELHVKVRWVREMFKPQTYTSEMQFPHTIFWLVLNGSWRMVINRREWIAQSGRLLVFPPNTVIGLKAGETEECIEYLSLCADVKLGSIDLTSLYSFPVATAIDDPALFSRLRDILRDAVHTFDDMTHLLQNDRAGDGKHHFSFNVQHLGLNAHIYLWLQQFWHVMQEGFASEAPHVDQRIMKVCNYIQQHLSQPLRLQQLAELVHISQSHLHSLFVKTLGQSPLEYILQSRIQLAKQLLIHSSCTIKEISENVGYGEQSQFSRMFRDKEGMSPAQFRQKIRSASYV